MNTNSGAGVCVIACEISHIWTHVWDQCAAENPWKLLSLTNTNGKHYFELFYIYSVTWLNISNKKTSCWLIVLKWNIAALLRSPEKLNHFKKCWFVFNSERSWFVKRQEELNILTDFKSWTDSKSFLVPRKQWGKTVKVLRI